MKQKQFPFDLWWSFVADLGMDEDDDEPVPLPNVNAAILKKVSLLTAPQAVTFLVLIVSN